MSENDAFWEIVAQSDLEPKPKEHHIELSDVASLVQCMSEASSWLSHYLMNAVESELPEVPAHLYGVLVLLQTSARQVISQLSSCDCKICKPVE